MGFLRSIKISGIRSIGPGEENEVEIRFQRPFTLISGQNGAGKTTVIECLKYATSGAFPPGTTKAKGWIHFPKGRNEEAETTKTGRKRKAANVTKVPARVHLELEVPAENGDINVISVSRKLEGTLKDGDMTTKTLEGTINIKDKRTGAPIENRKGLEILGCATCPVL
ncbi:Oidioi.mRNA.OKI2018_I69.XSR.g16684.t1.cds [Oikopleura dioica]|uniref:Oidioi.mRNA.OKI2018_I69.XSR.g16684.t1.cds n=1 Tax=Oikopleura dioica TaxID=34765 RepID=A0ABN7SLS1_OIKDI|nr:Oidioi.mRNA.OKI2018_I69.XSR.g16684.t1.cds [Oikopleura dioica]